MPPVEPESFVLTKKSAAISQLETAISLWFNYVDPVSILALAHNAQSCLAALSAHLNAPSLYKDWCESQPQGFQDLLRYVPNWIKHGRNDLLKRPRYHPIQAEILMIDSIACHQTISGKMTHLMLLFLARFLVENPDTVDGPFALALRKHPEIDDLSHRDRTQFLKQGLKRLSLSEDRRFRQRFG